MAIYPQNSETRAQTDRADAALVERLRQFERDTRIDTTLTIGEVAAMESIELIKFVRNTASRRGLELGIKHGDGVLRCLGKEFQSIKQNHDGAIELPRGLELAIRLVHRANNNGHSGENAVEQINLMVDLAGHYACGLPKPPIKQ